MSDQERETSADSDVAPEKDEKLEDLEPREGEGDAVKGGGGTTQQDQGGSGPENRL
jgi:hypothetical protein